MRPPTTGPACGRARRSRGRGVILDTARQLVRSRRGARHYREPPFRSVSVITFAI